MPLIGWWAGSYFQEFIASIDHWIAFGLLAIIGGNMIRESLRGEEEACEDKSLTLKTILILAVATSIDALAVGISFAFLQVHIWTAITVIGVTTFVLSFIAVYLGNRLGDLLEKYAGHSGRYHSDTDWYKDSSGASVWVEIPVDAPFSMIL